MIIALQYNMQLTSNKNQVVSYNKIFNSTAGVSNAFDASGR